MITLQTRKYPGGVFSGNYETNLQCQSASKNENESTYQWARWVDIERMKCNVLDVGVIARLLEVPHYNLKLYTVAHYRKKTLKQTKQK